MSDKNPQEQQNTTEDTPIAEDDLDTVAGGIVEGGCTEPTFGGGGGFGGGGASGSW